MTGPIGQRVLECLTYLVVGHVQNLCCFTHWSRVWNEGEEDKFYSATLKKVVRRVVPWRKKVVCSGGPYESPEEEWPRLTLPWMSGSCLSDVWRCLQLTAERPSSLKMRGHSPSKRTTVSSTRAKLFLFLVSRREPFSFHAGDRSRLLRHLRQVHNSETSESENKRSSCSKTWYFAITYSHHNDTLFIYCPLARALATIINKHGWNDKD